MNADNFKNDWYGWVTNQWAHTLLGILAYSVAMFASFKITGEYASREVIFGAVVLIYLTWELLTTRKKLRWDALEDLMFVCFYGAGSIAVAMHEVQPGSTHFTGDMAHLAPIQGLFVLHTVLGVAFRLIGRRQA